jgi:hypothetical protein
VVPLRSFLPRRPADARRPSRGADRRLLLLRPHARCRRPGRGRDLRPLRRPRAVVHRRRPPTTRGVLPPPRAGRICRSGPLGPARQRGRRALLSRRRLEPRRRHPDGGPVRAAGRSPSLSTKPRPSRSLKDQLEQAAEQQQGADYERPCCGGLPPLAGEPVAEGGDPLFGALGRERVADQRQL